MQEQISGTNRQRTTKSEPSVCQLSEVGASVACSSQRRLPGGRGLQHVTCSHDSSILELSTATKDLQEGKGSHSPPT